MTEEQLLAVLSDQLAHSATLHEGVHPEIGTDDRWEAGYAAGRATLARELQDLLAQRHPQVGPSNEQVVTALTEMMLGAEAMNDPVNAEYVRIFTEANTELVFTLRRYGFIGNGRATQDEDVDHIFAEFRRIGPVMDVEEAREWQAAIAELARRGYLRAP